MCVLRVEVGVLMVRVVLIVIDDNVELLSFVCECVFICVRVVVIVRCMCVGLSGGGG